MIKMAVILETVITVIIGLLVNTSHAANVALNKPANQTGVWGGMVAGRGVDGEKDKLYSETRDYGYYKGVCAHPDTGNNMTRAAWWVDLQEVYRITSVTVWNNYASSTAASWRLRRYAVTTQLTGHDEIICGSQINPEVSSGASAKLMCPDSTYANKVYIRRTLDTDMHLVTICEVEVEGTFVAKTWNNIARGKQTNQTGTHQNNADWVSSKAVDGRFSDANADSGRAHCARIDHPDNTQPAEWWVDLGDLHIVSSIIVYNTYFTYAAARMTMFTLGVVSPGRREAVCGGEHTETVASGGSAVSVCDAGTVGRYVHFARTGPPDINRVTLCEVIVLGEKLDVLNRTNEKAYIDNSTDTMLGIYFEQIPISSDLARFYSYRIQYWSDEAHTNEKDIGLDRESTNYIYVMLDNLEPNTNYTIRIASFRSVDNTRKEGWPYPIILHKTQCGEPNVPEDVQVEEGSGHIQITYKKPSSHRCNSFSTVTAKYRLKSSNEWQSQPASSVGDPITIPVTTAGTYEFQVVVTNDGGLQSSSEIKEVTVKASPSPGTPSPSPTNTPAPALSTPAPTAPDTSAQTTAGGGTSSSSTSPDSSKMALYIAVPIVGAIVIVVLIVFLVLFLRRRKNHKSSAEAPSPKPPVIPLPSMPAKPVKTKQKPVVLPVPVDQPSTVVQPKPAVQPPEESDEESMVSLEENPYMNTVITLSELEGYVANRKSNAEIFEDEFKSLPQPRNSLCVTAQTDDNKVKNRFLNIYPYDSSRVILNSAATELETDYINANYISGYKGKPKVYIATQGTRPNTLDDFWHMIWQEKADRIVMVANISEGNKTRVTPYWPKALGERVTLRPFVVTLEGEEVSAEYTTRTMSLEHQGESRTVRQFHFTCWKDKGRPDYGPPSLLAFLRKVRSLDNISKGPLIVHCSAGVGRTGTFIALDILLKQMASENQVDIYGCVYKLRQERMTMVQVKDQYVFLHDAMVEQMKVGHFAYSCDNLSERLASLSQSHSGEPSDIDKQFKLLRYLISRPDSKEKAGLTKTNRNKNRDMNVIPYDNGRPHLSTPYSKGNDYINATLADSFKKHNFYLVTQMPLPGTIVDFWRLVWDHDCHTIIMLNEVDSEDATLEEYWPEEPNKPTQYGPIKVSMSRQDKVTDAIITRDFTVEKGSINADASRRSNRSPLEVRQFQLLTWPDDEVLPPRREDLLDLLDQVLSWQQTKQLSDKSGEVIVHCLNGRGACCVFCGVSFTLDRMKMEQEVDALMAARRVSAHRPEFFNTAAEYRALYEMAITKIEKYNDYTNG